MTHMKTQNFVTSVEFVRKISANIWSLGYYNPQGKILPKVLMGGAAVWNKPWNLLPISDQSLWFPVPFFRTEPKIDIQFQTSKIRIRLQYMTAANQKCFSYA